MRGFVTARQTFAVLTLSIFLATPCLAGGLPKDLDQYITSGMKDWNIPGLSIAVVKDGTPVLLKGYGVLQAGQPEKVGADTIFAIGSATKAFTSAAIGKLVEADVIAWNDHVVAHWPEFRMSNPWVTKEIRVSDLLANHSGLSVIAEQIWYGTGHDREELIKRLAEVPITEGFRYQFQYRNLMFLAAGQLIPRVTDKSWDNYLAENFFEPLKMDRTTTTLREAFPKGDLAQPHMIDYDGNPVAIAYRNIENVGPAGSIMSTAGNMANWIHMLSTGGTFFSRPILDPRTLAFIERSQTPLSTVGPGGEPRSLPKVALPSYALSWVTESYRGTRLVWHNGSIDGMSAWVGMAPDLRLGVVILSNLQEANFRNAIFYRIIDSYIGTKLSDLSPKLLDKSQAGLDDRNHAEQKWQALNDQPIEPLLPIADYAQKYANPAFGAVDIVVEDGRLLYHRTPSMVLDLVCEDAVSHTFLGKYRSVAEDLGEGKVTIRFEVREDGKVIGFSEGAMDFQAD